MTTVTAEGNGQATTASSITAAAATTAAVVDPVATAQAKYAKEINAYISEQVRFADLKAGAVLTLTLAIGGALGKAVPTIVGAANGKMSTKIFFVVLLLLSTVETAIAIFYATRSLIPRVPPAGPPSLNSFPDIAEHEPNDYSNKIAALTERDIAKNLSIHNVALSRVAKNKFSAITTATWALLVLIFTAFLIVVFYVLANV